MEVELAVAGPADLHVASALAELLPHVGEVEREVVLPCTDEDQYAHILALERVEIWAGGFHNRLERSAKRMYADAVTTTQLATKL